MPWPFAVKPEGPAALQLAQRGRQGLEMPGAAVGPVVQLSAANQPPDAALPTARALLRFGVVADVQYADLDEGTNFLRTVTRYYRHAGEALQQAVRCWLAHGLLQDQEEPVAFVAQLGDLIDGLNAYQEPPQTAAASATVMRWLHPLHEVGIPVHHVVGNHEVMNFTRAELHAAPLPAEATAAGGASFFSGGTPGEQRRAAAAAAEAAAAGASITARPELTFPCAVDDPGGEQGFRSYHSFVHPTLTTWRFIVLDAFAISTLGWADDHPNSIAAWALLAEHNPNDCRASGVNLLAGMEGVESRWMPYNGAYGEVQLRWLAEELAEAHEAGQRVVVLTHVGVQPGCCLDDNLAWDYAEVKSVLHSVGPGVVAAVLSGHDHNGGYSRDEAGIHHVTFKAPLETPPPGLCHAVVEVHDGALVVYGYGRQDSMLLPL